MFIAQDPPSRNVWRHTASLGCVVDARWIADSGEYLDEVTPHEFKRFAAQLRHSNLRLRALAFSQQAACNAQVDDVSNERVVELPSQIIG
jgi:hypothetical protein